MSRFRLTLYVTGQTSTSVAAINNLRRLIRDHLHNDCEVVVVDVLESPHLAEETKILATPTLIREEPLPRRRVIGDLSDVARVLSVLDLPDMDLGNGTYQTA